MQRVLGFPNPITYGPTYDCYYWANDVGRCAQHRETTPCGAETYDGGVAVTCNDPSAMVAAWCGP